MDELEQGEILSHRSPSLYSPTVDSIPETILSDDQSTSMEDLELTPLLGTADKKGAVKEEAKIRKPSLPLIEPVTTSTASPKRRSSKADTLCKKCSEHYRPLNKISEGTYGAVMRAEQIDTGKIVALKKFKYHKQFWQDGVPFSYLREINSLLKLQHPNILSVEEVVLGQETTSFFLVMEYVEHELKVALDTGRPAFSMGEKKSLIMQLIEGVAFMHDNFWLHRDLKTSNLLYSNKGLVKICDFGMARMFSDPVKSYTQRCCTLWYRCPELLLGFKKYNEAVDVWGVGCIMAEILLGKPIFTGQNEKQQIESIFELTGTPTRTSWPAFYEMGFALQFRTSQPSWRKRFPSPQEAGRSSGVSGLSGTGLDLLKQLLEPNPDNRISMRDALKHDYFTRDRPMPQKTSLMPSVPETNAMARKHVKTSPKLGQIDATSYLAELEKITKKQKIEGGHAKGTVTDRLTHHRDGKKGI